MTRAGRGKIAHRITSKEIRLEFNSMSGMTNNKLIDISSEDAKAYFKRIRALTSTKHKNIALRVWNGDVLGRERLYNMGLSDDKLCLHCHEIETQIHVIKDCVRAKALWRRLELKGGGESNWLGVGDLELQLECLWHLVNNKELTANEIWCRSLTFITAIKTWKAKGMGDINVEMIMQGN